MNKALVLGAGLVVKPLLDELSRHDDLEVEVAALNIDRARELVAPRPRARARELDVGDRGAVLEAVRGADVVISLLPADRHAGVAELCLEARVPLVTSSYVSDEMRALDPEARRRGVLLLNETGLDPGIDHMMAVEVIRRVRHEGGEILSFASYCGGLPAPSSNDNPWGYKLSWSPRGVLLSGRSPVRYLQGGDVVEHPHPYGLGAVRCIEVPQVGTLEVYPTRDSLKYREPYQLEALPDLFRGTLRYPGWSLAMKALIELHLLDLEERELAADTYGAWISGRLDDAGATPASGLRQRLAHHLGLDPAHDVLERFEWLGLLSDQPLPARRGAPLDLVAHLLQQRMQYAPGEQDMVALEHHFVATTASGRRRRIIKRLLVFGTAGDDSAMAMTVGTPAGLACGLILGGKVDLVGVHIPVAEQLATPILASLAERGVKIEEVEEDLE